MTLHSGLFEMSLILYHSPSNCKAPGCRAALPRVCRARFAAGTELPPRAESTFSPVTSDGADLYDLGQSSQDPGQLLGGYSGVVAIFACAVSAGTGTSMRILKATPPSKSQYPPAGPALTICEHCLLIFTHVNRTATHACLRASRPTFPCYGGCHQVFANAEERDRHWTSVGRCAEKHDESLYSDTVNAMAHRRIEVPAKM